jgi:hypothetical protein
MLKAPVAIIDGEEDLEKGFKRRLPIVLRNLPFEQGEAGAVWS